MLDHHTVWVDLAHDGLHPFAHHDDKSSNIVLVRLRSVATSFYNKQVNVRVVVVADKKCGIWSIYHYILEQLYRLRPGHETLSYTRPDGTEAACHILLAGIFGDMIARQELTSALGPAAYLGCDYCLFNGCRMPVVQRTPDNVSGPIWQQYLGNSMDDHYKLVYAGYCLPVLQDRYIGSPYFQPPDRITQAEEQHCHTLKMNLPEALELHLPADGRVKANDASM